MHATYCKANHRLEPIIVCLYNGFVVKLALLFLLGECSVALYWDKYRWASSGRGEVLWTQERVVITALKALVI